MTVIFSQTQSNYEVLESVYSRILDSYSSVTPIRIRLKVLMEQTANESFEFRTFQVSLSFIERFSMKNTLPAYGLYLS